MGEALPFNTGRGDSDGRAGACSAQGASGSMGERGEIAACTFRAGDLSDTFLGGRNLACFRLAEARFRNGGRHAARFAA